MNDIAPVITMDDENITEVLHELGYDMGVAAFGGDYVPRAYATKENIQKLRTAIDDMKVSLTTAIFNLTLAGCGIIIHRDDNNTKVEGLEDIIIANKLIKTLSESLYYLETVSSGCRDYQFEQNISEEEDFEAVNDCFDG